MKIVCCWMYAIGKYGFPPSQGFDGYYAVDLEQLCRLEQCFVEGKQFLQAYAEKVGL